MKRHELLRHPRWHGCYLKREGAAHSLWCNSQDGQVQAVPRHTEIPNRLVQRICQALGIPPIGG
jgi:mRNA interferase HicA